MLHRPGSGGKPEWWCDWNEGNHMPTAAHYTPRLFYRVEEIPLAPPQVFLPKEINMARRNSQPLPHKEIVGPTQYYQSKTTAFTFQLFIVGRRAHINDRTVAKSGEIFGALGPVLQHELVLMVVLYSVHHPIERADKFSPVAVIP